MESIDFESFVAGEKIIAENFTNWTSGNELIDNFIQKRQLEIKNNEVVFEWIPYSRLIITKEAEDNCLATAIWDEGPLSYDAVWCRKSYCKVTLRFLYDSQNITDEFINKIESYGANYGMSQNPDTKIYILVFDDKYSDCYCRKCEKQLKYNGSGVVFEWILYDELIGIKELGDNCLTTAIWEDGPLHYDKNENEWIRTSCKQVFLRFFCSSQNITDDFINKIESYLSDYRRYYYGISQNPDTKVYILVFDDEYSDCYCEKCGNKYGVQQNKWCKPCQINNITNRTSGNKKIDNFIREEQLKFGYNTVFEWIPYNEFIEIKELGKDSIAIWKNGPLCYNANNEKLIRESYKIVYLKNLYNSPDITDGFLNMIETFLKNGRGYGISQNSNSDTKVYILVFDDKFLDDCCINCDNFTNWTSGNEKIDEIIQKIQLNINNHDDVIFEWIPYNEFIEINEMDRENGFDTAIWKMGPLFYNIEEERLMRISYKKYEKVCLKYLHNSQNITDEFLNQVESYLKRNNGYGLSQNPDTKDYIFVYDNNYFEEYCEKCGDRYKNDDEKWCKPCHVNHLKNNFMNWTSGNSKIDEFVQRLQLKINKHNDVIFEWIPYNEFISIKETRNDLATAIWKEGPLCYNKIERKYKRRLNEKVLLKYLNDSQNINYIILNKIANSFGEDYGLSQNPTTKDFILVLQLKHHCQYCGEKYNNEFEMINKRCILCQANHENDEINDFVKEMRLKADLNSVVVFQWIPYDQFNDIKEIGKGGFSTVYSAVWDGSLYNENVILKCIHNSRNFLDKFLNKVKAYSNQMVDNIFKLYGISQNSDTKDYIIVLENAKYRNFNNYLNYLDENNESFTWKERLNLLVDIIYKLYKIHQYKMIHRNLHIGNILLSKDKIVISDIGLYGKIDDMDETNIYGVMPYVAPEVLKGKLYTKAADIYSFKHTGDCQKTEQHCEDCKIRKQFEETNDHERNPLSIINNQSTIHTQAIYTSRLLNPFTINLSKCDN
ncbi:kinase-like domain-containing protein [Rhizophagus clarus]|uniref:Kinase-like domain-containing protein n=1 Tax=Rhizophagus clarus TaxID=94130 RepID=A0A8H3R025_9GLOM|nr:kinase-like domain-containing protein [Rhizophagus clarus]